MFENSKVALAFAGVTLFGAAMFVGTMGGEGPGALVPKAAERDRAVEPSEARRKQDDDQPVFSDYVSDEELGFAAFAKDEELIDNTIGASTDGFDPTPDQPIAIITSPSSSDDQSDFADSTPTSDSLQASAPRTRASRRAASPRSSTPSESNVKLPKSDVAKKLDANPPVLTDLQPN